MDTGNNLSQIEAESVYLDWLAGFDNASYWPSPFRSLFIDGVTNCTAVYSPNPLGFDFGARDRRARSPKVRYMYALDTSATSPYLPERM